MANKKGDRIYMKIREISDDKTVIQIQAYPFMSKNECKGFDDFSTELESGLKTHLIRSEYVSHEGYNIIKYKK